MRFFLLLSLFAPLTLFAQLSLNDNFADGDFTNNPQWSGNTADFEVLNGELHLNNTSATADDTSYLSTPSTILSNGSWQFYYRFEQNPSSSNYGRVYVASDQGNLSGPLNGYYVDFGQSGDKLRLRRQSGNTSTTITESSGPLLNTSTVEVRVQVTRDAGGLWTLMADTGSVINPPTTIGTPTTDVTHSNSSFFGVYCRYTVTRASAFYFDDFNCAGQPNLDVTPPALDTILVLTANSLRLDFNERLDAVSAQQTTRYSVSNGIGPPSSAVLGGTDFNEVTLTFTNPFSNATNYSLSCNSIEDTAGNAANLQKSFTVNDEPASIVAVRVVSPTVISINFSEAVNALFAANTANFQVDNGVGAPASTAQPAPSRVELQFASALQSGINYRLSVQNIEDGFGSISTDTAFFSVGAINIFDDFSDGDFTNNPGWQGDAADFEVDANHQLHLNSPVAGTSYLSTASRIAQNAQWQFYVKMDFATSSSNFARVYLMSRDSNLNDSTTRGYYVLLGGTNDEIAIFRQEGNSKSAVLRSAPKVLDTDPVELLVRIQRDAQGTFTLEADTTLSGNFFTVGSATDSTFLSSEYFGVYCEYTSTRADRFYFDDFKLSGDPFIDSIAPAPDSVFVERVDRLQLFFTEDVTLPGAENEANYTIVGLGTASQATRDSQNPALVNLEFPVDLAPGVLYRLNVDNVADAAGNSAAGSIEFQIDDAAPRLEEINVLNSTTLELVFREDVLRSTAEEESNYFVSNGQGQPMVAQVDPGDDARVQLVFANPFQDRITYSLQVADIEDDFGNTLDTNANFTFFIPEAGSVVINEIMADPVPRVGVPPNALPEREYLELYNRESIPVNIKGWILQLGTSQEVLPFYEMPAQGFVLITGEDGVNEFDPSIPVLGLDISSTVLTNSGKELTLFSKEGLQISTVSYTDAWYADPDKDDGGWSLEQIDPDNRCGGESNWAASQNPIGGSPGRENSLLGSNPDTTRPAFERIAVLGDSLIRLSFSERVNELLLADESNYRIQPPLEISLADPQGPAFSSSLLYFNEPINPEVIYRLSLVDYPEDCNNNRMREDTLLFTIPSVPQPGDILINELLFNPPTGGSDFVEIYNNSDRLFDLQYLRLGHVDPLQKTFIDSRIITEESYLLEPGRYLALTGDRDFVLDYYKPRIPENVVEVDGLPSMNDDEGSMAIATSALELIDFYEYDEDHHLALIDPEGVSLERQSFEGPSNDPGNWQSAASTVGFATPGYLNSQRVIPDFSARLGVNPKVFSPNQDGYNDEVSLTYNFESPNNILSVSIWSSTGQKLKTLLNNQNVGRQGFVQWDGTDDSGNLMNTGIYIVVFDYFNTEGAHRVEKQSCVLSL